MPRSFCAGSASAAPTPRCSPSSSATSPRSSRSPTPATSKESCMDHDAVVDLLRRDMSPEEYDEISELWERHSIAEDARDLPGLIATLAEDCVYELVQTGDRW